MSTLKPLVKWSGSKRSQADRLASFRPFDVIMNLLSAVDLCFIESVQKRLWLEILANP